MSAWPAHGSARAAGSKLEFEDILDVGPTAADSSSGADDGSARPSVRTLMPIVVVALIGVVAAAVFTSNDEDSPTGVVRTPTSTIPDRAAAGAATSDAPTPAAVSGDHPSTLATPDESPETVTEPADLADIDATHLALAVRAEVLFLEHETGTWSRHDAPDFWPTHLPVEPFDGGVLLPRGHDALLVDVDGDTTVIGSDVPSTRLIGAGDRVVLVRDDSGAPLEPTVVTAYIGWPLEGLSSGRWPSLRAERRRVRRHQLHLA